MKRVKQFESSCLRVVAEPETLQAMTSVILDVSSGQGEEKECGQVLNCDPLEFKTVRT